MFLADNKILHRDLAGEECPDRVLANRLLWVIACLLTRLHGSEELPCGYGRHDQDRRFRPSAARRFRRPMYVGRLCSDKLVCRLWLDCFACGFSLT
jgi:hypothetical protein